MSIMHQEYYQSPSCYRIPLHIAARHSCQGCSYVDSCPFGFNVKTNPLVSEMRIDFAGKKSCNLSCKLCWAKTRSPNVLPFSTNDILDRLRACLLRLTESTQMLVREQKIRNPEFFKFSDFQITGGEPLISAERADHVIAMMNGLDRLITEEPAVAELFRVRKSGHTNDRVIVRLFTNGIALGKDQVTYAQLKILGNLQRTCADILVSMKGTNEAEFMALQDRDWTREQGLHSYQIAAVAKLKELEREIGTSNINVRLVIGMYHSSEYDLDLGSGTTVPAFRDWSDSLAEIVREYFRDGKSINVEPVSNPYLGRSKTLATRWENDMGSILKKPATLEPNLKPGRGRTLSETTIAFNAFKQTINK